MTTALLGPHLPWTPIKEEEQRFRRIFGWVLLLALTFGVVIPNVPLPALETEQQPPLPPRVVRVLAGDAVLPPAVDEAEAAVATVTQKPTDSEPAAPSRTPEAPTVAVASRPPSAPSRGAESLPDSPSAQSSGVLALQGPLAALQSRPSSLSTSGPRVVSGVTTSDVEPKKQASFSLKDPDEAATAGISQIAERSPIAVARLEQLSTQAAERAPSNAGSVQESTPRRTKRNGVSRSREEIQEILDRHKGVIYALYHRELETDPTLSGRVILSLTISSSGVVTACRVTNTELGSPAFEGKLVQQIKRIDFGPKPEAAPVTTTVPIEFLPT